MSHFLGTPSHSRVWALKHSEYVGVLERAKASRNRLLSGPTVDIYVGPEKRHWSLHKNLLCHHSSYFETEFQGHEVPKKEHIPSHNTLELPDDDPRGFELLVKWLYQGTLEDASHMTDEAKYDYAVACHKLYQLCDKFDMIHVKNLAMDAYRSNLHAAQLVPDADEINDIYRASPRGSPFRKLMTKIAARQIMDPGVDKDADSYRACFDGSPDFAVDMINAIRFMSGGMLFDDPTKDEDCLQWHDHRDGSRCYLKNKGKAHIYVDKGPYQSPNSVKGKRHLQPLQLAELSERPTPRKLNVATPKSPVTPRTSSSKQTPKIRSSIGGQPLTPARQTSVKKNADHASAPAKVDAHPAAPEPDSHTDRGDLTNGAPNPRKKVAIRTHPTSTFQANGIVHRPTKSPQKVTISPRKRRNMAASPAKRPQRVGNDVPSDKASSVASGPRSVSHLNGIARNFDSVNGAYYDSRPSSLADRSEAAGRKLPPKLKRKSPG